MNFENLRKKMVPFAGTAFFLFLGMLIFFGGAFLIVLFRTETTEQIRMPDIVGKNYVEVHNELQRLQLKIQLETRRFPNQNDGMILYQSVTGGKLVDRGSKVYLGVNIGVDRVVMPDLKGQNIENAKSGLSKVLSGETYVALELGGVTFVPAQGEQLPGTIIDQIPHAGLETTTRQKVYLLAVQTQEQSRALAEKGPIAGMPFPMVAEKLEREGAVFKVRKVIPTRFRQESGLVAAFSKSRQGIWLIDVYYHNPEHRFQSGYEAISYKLDDSGKYSLLLKSEGGQEKLILPLTDFQSGEEMNVVFYRVGRTQAILRDSSGREIESIEYKSEL